MTPDRTMVLTVATEMAVIAALMWVTGKLLDRRQKRRAVRRAWLRDFEAEARERDGRQP